MFPCRVLVLISDKDRRHSGTSNYSAYVVIKKTTCTIIYKTYSIQNILFIVKYLSIILLVKKILMLLLVW